MIKDFNYWLTGIGWAEVYFSSDKQTVRFEVSYLSDPLKELFFALSRMLKGETDNEKIAFWDESGQHLLILSKRTEDKIDVIILCSDSWGKKDDADVPLSERQVVYSNTDTLANFASIVCVRIDSLLERHTLIEYKEKRHEFPFPIETYEQLKQAI